VEGFTFWSHVRGLDLVVPVPASFVGDPAWPALGRVMGDRVYGSADVNANANLFSGDGVAAAGAVGVMVMGILFTAWIVMIDRVSARWDRRFALLVIVPVALSLTNGHFFTTLMSFGGLFWLGVFALHRPAGRLSGGVPFIGTLAGRGGV
jgi:hypothetical protein